MQFLRNGLIAILLRRLFSFLMMFVAPPRLLSMTITDARDQHLEIVVDQNDADRRIRSS